MYFVNKVMGPDLKCDNEDVVNMDDTCVQQSSFGKDVFVHFLQLTKYSS